uniref:Chondroitin sulfate proteoglycan 4 n=1 Tax=Panagrolaimus superbus TaxID=310955 RepID=A0A914YY90_9BILA
MDLWHYNGKIFIFFPNIEDLEYQIQITLFTEDHLKVWDSDSSTENVFIRVRNTVGGAKFTPKNNDTALSKFSLSDFLNHQIYISIDSASTTRTSASAELDAIDSEGIVSSKSVVLKITASPVEIHMVKNTGIKLLHKSSAIISAQNLSFTLLTGGSESEMDVPINFQIVDQPEFGIVECLKSFGIFEVCSTFTQKDLEAAKIRYKQTTENRPKSDVFSFKVEAGDTESVVHDFQLEFIPISLRVFIQESLLLNNTEVAKITRSNLLATSFPYNFPRDQLIYHIVEPPKFGMLSRKIAENKNRRIGVSSNFTQEHIDSETLTYKLHFIHYSVVNDFFVFRLVTPAVTSELLRFEITYIPGGNSIQLINRTLIVSEGHSQSITNNSLFLETSDDTTFDFTVAIPPFNGNFILSNPSGSKLPLKAGDSFDTFDIVNRRLFYEHSGDETKEDKVYLIAESRYQTNSRIPFWFTITVISENDHPPELQEEDPKNHVIYLLEKGERTLTSSMFPWTDKDWNSKGFQPLSFAFTETSFRDYVFFTKLPTQMAIRTFTSKDLEDGNLVVRDLSLKKSTLMKYTVDDGKHKVSATVKFMTDTEEFLRLEKNVVKVPYEISSSGTGLIPISRLNLQAQTNMDFDDGKVHFDLISMKESPFRLLENGELKDVNTFIQEDINKANLFLLIGNSNLESIKIRLRLAKLETLTSIKLIRDSTTFYLNIQPSINLGESLVAVIDQSVINVEEIQDIKFTIYKQPEYGSLRIETSHEKLKSIFPSNNFVRGFYMSDLSGGKLQYICQRTNENDLNKENDNFSFKIHTPKMIFGPFKIIVKKQSVSELSLFSPGLLKVPVGSALSINEQILRFTKLSPAIQEAIFKVTKQPKFGTFANRNQPKTAITNFDYGQLKDDEIIYSPTSKGGFDSFSLIVCSKENLCSGETEIKVQIEQPNIYAPEIIKNDPLIQFNTNMSVLSTRQLHVQDLDSPTENLRYSIWQPIGGFVASKSNPTKPINGFSQQDLENDKIIFVSNTNISGGFSFLISDGLHQSKPEWFSVEKSTKISLTLEANSRLLAAPLQFSIIGMDLLRAKIPNVNPQQIIFTITRAPLHGRILLDKSKAVQKFTQADINARRISYRSDTSKLGAWSQKDSFSFVINVDGKASIKEEFRFKVLVTFGALTAEHLSQFIQTSNVIQIPIGSSFAFNSSHLNFDTLEKACGSKLIAEIYRKPTKGQLTFVQDELSDHASNSREEGISSKLLTNQLSSGRYLIYHSEASGNDEIIFHVYPSKEQTKRSSRLRVPFFIEISSRKSEIEIAKFRRELNLVSGGSTNFDPSDFQTTSENYSPSEVTFTLLQKGSNGIKVVVMDSKVDEKVTFTQAQINKGQIRLEHTPLSNDDRFDVLL